jgi:glycosyltransferase involved in cell wall biosynthesis
LAEDGWIIVAENIVPTTLWYSTIGTGDGHDYATRGYLSALMKSGYQGLRLSPLSYTSVLKTNKDLSMFEEIIRPPASARLKPLVRIQPGDPRIGTKVVINGMEVEITEGSTDLEARQEYSSPTRFAVCCVVIHHDPTSTCRQYAAMVKADRSPGVAYVAITVWEPSEIPRQIALVLSELDHIIVPSQHVKTAFEKSGVECPISVVPHSFNSDQWPEPTPEEMGFANKGGRFVFNTIATPIERKNLIGLMRAYFKAFEGYEDVVLRIKSNGDESLFKKMLNDAMEQSGISGRRPLVKIFQGQWPVAEIREFYLDSNCYVSATRGEGFGLPEMEASLCGRPVITTNWGAAPEVLAGRENVHLVDYNLVPVFNMYGIGCYEPEQLWADPKDDSLVEAMRLVYRRGAVSDHESWKLMNSRFSEDVVGASLTAVLGSAQLDAAGEGWCNDGFAK